MCSIQMHLINTNHTFLVFCSCGIKFSGFVLEDKAFFPSVHFVLTVVSLNPVSKSKILTTGGEVQKKLDLCRRFVLVPYALLELCSVFHLFYFQPLGEDILASLRDLEATLHDSAVDRLEGQSLSSNLQQECLYYLNTYGTHLALISFYMRHDCMTEALTYLLSRVRIAPMHIWSDESAFAGFFFTWCDVNTCSMM